MDASYWPNPESRFVGQQCRVCDHEIEATDAIAFEADESPVVMHWHCYEATEKARIEGLREAYALVRMTNPAGDRIVQRIVVAEARLKDRKVA